MSTLCLPLSVCLSVCLSVIGSVFVCLAVSGSIFVCLSVCLSVSVFLSVCLSSSVCLCVCLPVCLSVCVFVSFYVFLCACLSVCLSVCLPACLPTSPPVRLLHFSTLKSTSQSKHFLLSNRSTETSPKLLNICLPHFPSTYQPAYQTQNTKTSQIFLVHKTKQQDIPFPTHPPTHNHRTPRRLSTLALHMPLPTIHFTTVPNARSKAIPADHKRVNNRLRMT